MTMPEVPGRVSVQDPTTGTVFSSGVPVIFSYAHNPEPAAYYGSRFGQDIEPVGRYVNALYAFEAEAPPLRGWEYGEMKFHNPLVLRHGGYGPEGWKARISQYYGGLTGGDLSLALLADGVDGIITVRYSEYEEIPESISESVDLRVVQ